MNTYRYNAVVVGVLYIAATVAGVLSVVALSPVKDAADFLVAYAANDNRVIAGALLEITMAVAIAGIGFMIYPVLRKVNEGLALWYVGARLVESVMFIVGVICLLSVLSLSQELVTAVGPDASYFQSLGTVLLAARDWSAGMLSNVAGFGLSMLFFYYLLYRSRLVPRWLSGWGLVGAIPYIAAGILILFGEDTGTSFITLMYLPIAVNEMVLAVWLIVKGFNQPAIAALETG
ncbi:MAG: DUF4386 domain-containing protein [Thermoleophilia bacterium]|nr:DUF4386 domain-containing protein [Thermoleophilia bacterium]